ncbi:MAG: hypothetical protein AAGD34_01560 [Pseudomonadota bacterium]
MALKPLSALIAGTVFHGSVPAPTPAAETHAPQSYAAIATALATGAADDTPPSDRDAVAVFEGIAAKPRQCEGNCADCPMRKITLT